MKDTFRRMEDKIKGHAAQPEQPVAIKPQEPAKQVPVLASQIVPKAAQEQAVQPAAPPWVSAQQMAPPTQKQAELAQQQIPQPVAQVIQTPAEPIQQVPQLKLQPVAAEEVSSSKTRLIFAGNTCTIPVTSPQNSTGEIYNEEGMPIAKLGSNPSGLVWKDIDKVPVGTYYLRILEGPEDMQKMSMRVLDKIA